MKQLLVLCVLFFMLGILSDTVAQDKPSLKIVSLDQKDGFLAKPSEIALSPGDTLQFVAKNGDFDILIRDAYKFLKIKEDDLKARLDSSSPTEAKSDKYIVRKVEGIETVYQIYCISNNSWPDAPPRIIIKVIN